MKKQFFSAVGIEIEGGWRDLSRVLPIFKSDSSVRVPTYNSYHADINIHNNWEDQSPFNRAVALHRAKFQKLSGEIASPKLMNKKEIKSFINNNYPDNTDWSCGLHIHISFDTLLPYAGLMTQSFHQQLFSMLNKFGDKHAYNDNETEYNFWNRFKGNNTFTQKQFSPLPFLADKYRAINYSAFRNPDRHTFECRAFPAFQSKEVALKAVEAFLKLVEDYLKTWVEPTDPEIINNIRILKGYLRAHEPLNK